MARGEQLWLQKAATWPDPSCPEKPFGKTMHQVVETEIDITMESSINADRFKCCPWNSKNGTVIVCCIALFLSVVFLAITSSGSHKLYTSLHLVDESCRNQDTCRSEPRYKIMVANTLAVCAVLNAAEIIISTALIWNFKSEKTTFLTLWLVVTTIWLIIHTAFALIFTISSSDLGIAIVVMVSGIIFLAIGILLLLKVLNFHRKLTYPQELRCACSTVGPMVVPQHVPSAPIYDVVNHSQLHTHLYSNVPVSSGRV